MTKTKIILDTDIGSDVDDALALVYALNNKDLEVIAVTTVYGDVSLRAKIARKILDYSGNNHVPIYTGVSKPISTLYRSIFYTGKEGDGILSEADILSPLEKMSISENAIDFLIEKFSNSPGTYSLITIGPLTNLAKVLQKHPGIQNCIKHHYIMGGSFYSAEHNIACDVKAAQTVFSSSTPKTIIPLDVTVKTRFFHEDFRDLAKGNKLQRILKNMVDIWFMFKHSMSMGDFPGFICMHDPITIATITKPEFITFRRSPLKINNQGFLSYESDNLMNLAIDINSDLFKKHFLEVLLKKTSS